MIWITWGNGRKFLCPLSQGSLVGMNIFKDAGHLFRFAGLFVIAFLVFWAIRGYVVPKTFGQYGHYRGSRHGRDRGPSSQVRRPRGVRDLPLRRRGRKEQGKARRGELRSVPRPPGCTCRRSHRSRPPNSTRRCCACAVMRPARPGPRASRRWWPTSTPTACPARPAISRIARQSVMGTPPHPRRPQRPQLQEVQNESRSPSFPDSAARRRGGVEGRPGRNTRSRRPTTR